MNRKPKKYFLAETFEQFDFRKNKSLILGVLLFIVIAVFLQKKNPGTLVLFCSEIENVKREISNISKSSLESHLLILEYEGQIVRVKSSKETEIIKLAARMRNCSKEIQINYKNKYKNFLLNDMFII